jgi:TolA-binding protein
VRAWVLLVKGEAARLLGNRDDARTQFDLAQDVQPAGPVTEQATFRLALANFELREYTETLRTLASVLNTRTAPDVRLAALLLQGEAAYHASDYATAATAFRRALQEFPTDAQAPATRLSLAWTALRQGRSEDARQEFLGFAMAAPGHPHAADALLLASELAMAGGDLPGARALIDRLIAAYPAHPRADFARLNRAILLVRGRDFSAAEPALREWLARGQFPALLGRAHAALGVTLLARGNAMEATNQFAQARREGLGPFASLGFGAIALSTARLDDAARAFTEARDAGTPDLAAAAEYGLAAVAFGRGKLREFRAPALAALNAAPTASSAPALLYALTGIAVEEKDWPEALGLARRLVAEFPTSELTDDALERVGAGAAAVPVWPVVYEAYTLLRSAYPRSPFVDDARLRLAVAQMETGRTEAGRQELELFVSSAPNDPRLPQALLLLARAREAGGDRAGALEAYGRAAREGQGPEWSKDELFGYARLLATERRWDQARTVLDRLLRVSDTALAAEAAQGIGDTYAGEGDLLAAAEYYLTAAYLTPESATGRRSLLAAGRSFAGLKQNEAASVVYRKLLAQSGLPADLAAAARQGLAAVSR